MSRLGQLHMITGFWLIFIASCGGFFVADDHQKSLMQQRPGDLLAWWMLLQSSAHGHTNLFGMLHILTGLTLPYSELSNGWKNLQFVGLAMGSFAMSVLMLVRSWRLPKPGVDSLGVVMGGMLAGALIAIILHIVGLTIRWFNHGSMD